MRFSEDGPLVSCCMVTANRARIAARAVACFKEQTWGNRELVVVDFGSEDYSSLFADIPVDRCTYLRLDWLEPASLSDLRNVGLSRARGELVARWDDFDWYHPDRISRQVATLGRHAAACVLPSTLMHLDACGWNGHAFVGSLQPGVPGSVMHRTDESIRYRSETPMEDLALLRQWDRRDIAALEAPHLFVSAYSGMRTWEEAHRGSDRFSSPSALDRIVRRQSAGHPEVRTRLKLSATEALSIHSFLGVSRSLGLLEW